MSASGTRGKGYITFFLTAVMMFGLVFMLVTRERSPHDAPAEIVEVQESADGGDAGLDASPGALGDAAIDAAPAKPADKPLRIVTLGWELVAPGAALAASAPAIELAPETALDAVEQRLARGGADPQGADIAIVPLPALVASFERLRALEPRAFLVVGFSHGREEVRVAPGALLKAPPTADEVKFVALGPATASETTARVAGSESATVLGLFALDLLGVAPSRLRFVAPGSADAKGAFAAALVKGVADDRPRAFSTTDAARLVPIVAVAPKGVLDARESVVREWSKAWLDGALKAKSDVPGIARKLAAKEGLSLAAAVSGAPEALALVERLGQLENTSLEEQTSFVGPLAKGALTLDTLAQRTWQLARGGGLTGAATPEPLPIDARVVAAIAPPPKPPAPIEYDPDAGSPFGPVPTGATPLLSYRSSEADPEKAAAQIAFLAEVFDRSVFRITAKGGDKATRAIAGAARARGIAAVRLTQGAGDPQGAAVVVDVLSL